MTERKSTTGNQLVLVTGNSGYVDVNCVLQLLNVGCNLQATVQQEAMPQAKEEHVIPADQTMVKLGLLGDL